MSQEIRIAVKFVLLTVFVLFVNSCATKSASQLPREFMGISIGMNKTDAQKRLEEIAVFERDERKRQQVWRLKDDPSFAHIAVGYDEGDRIRYVTAFVEKSNAKARVKFSEVGDISKARQEIVEPHYRYTWDVPATEAVPAYQIILYGDEPEFVSYFTMAKNIAPDGQPQ